MLNFILLLVNFIEDRCGNQFWIVFFYTFDFLLVAATIFSTGVQYVVFDLYAKASAISGTMIVIL